MNTTVVGLSDYGLTDTHDDLGHDRAWIVTDDRPRADLVNPEGMKVPSEEGMLCLYFCFRGEGAEDANFASSQFEDELAEWASYPTFVGMTDNLHSNLYEQYVFFNRVNHD